MNIVVNEFRSIDEAVKAQTEFPFCAECKSGNKLQQFNGRTFLLCISRPQIHHGIGNWL